MIGPIHILTICLFVTPLAILAVYGCVLFPYYRRGRSKTRVNAENADQTFQPKVSVLIPTHNEMRIIPKKIETLLALSYPKERIDFIFIDDSNDSTPNIIQDYADKSANIRLIHSNNRMGYSASMILGCKSAEGEILVFNDAGSFLEESAIANLVRHFQDPHIGAVTGRSTMLNKNEAVGRSEDWYLSIADFTRISETNMDSTFHFNGEACAVRRELITDLSSCPATFDTAVALHVRKKGYRTVFDPSARFYEYAPQTHTDRIKQKTIRATNLVRILLEFRSMIFKRRYGSFGCFILPVNLALLTVVPVAILLSTISLTVLTFFDPFFTIPVWGSIGIVLLISVLLAKKMVITFFEFEYSLLKAFWLVFFARKSHDKIETIASTRR